MVQTSGINSPVEVGSSSHYLQGFSTIQTVVVWDFWTINREDDIVWWACFFSQWVSQPPTASCISIQSRVIWTLNIQMLQVPSSCFLPPKHAPYVAELLATSPSAVMRQVLSILTEYFTFLLVLLLVLEQSWFICQVGTDPKHAQKHGP